MTTHAWPASDIVAFLQAVVAFGCIPLAMRDRHITLRCLGWCLMACGYGVAAASRVVFYESSSIERPDMYFSRVVAMLLIAAGIVAMTWGYFFRREIAQ